MRITYDNNALREFCCGNGIRKLSFFGSVLRDAFGPESDIDVLVEFDPGRTPGYSDLSRMERELG
jgi:predicted nucleotidyltransferase